MLENWLAPLPPLESPPPDSLLGARIARHTANNFPSLRRAKIALVGIEPVAADTVRQTLAAMSAGNFPKNVIADLGNLRRAEPTFIIQVVHELLSGKILPILIGGPDELATAQFLAYHETKSLVNLVVVDEKTRFGEAPENFYNKLLLPRHPALFHFGLVGNQVHQSDAEAMQIIANQNFDNLRLGRCRPSLEESEPILRDADLLCFHLAALKMSEAPAVAGGGSPSGFFSEEACQICRYAGFSDKLTSFGIFGFESWGSSFDSDPAETQHPKLKTQYQTAQVAAQMIWYFLEGFFTRKKDFPASTDGLTEYIVDLPQLNYQITFWKSTRSSRWWMQVPVETKRRQQRHRLVPCSYSDYQAAANREELPDRLIRAFSRFG